MWIFLLIYWISCCMNFFQGINMARLIKSWDELNGLQSENYYLDIDSDLGCGHIYRKSDNELMDYLSTHSFYGKSYKDYTIMLQEYGFDVQLKNWDGETEEVNYRDQWLWHGKCNLCRRFNYCHKQCKAHRKYMNEKEIMQNFLESINR